MEQSYIPKNTNTHKAPLPPHAPNSLARCNSLPLNQVAERPPLLNQAENLDLGSSEPSLIARQAKAASQPFHYDLQELITLPPEIQYVIFSHLDQERLEIFFEAIKKNILLEMHAHPVGSELTVSQKPLVQLLGIAMMSFSKAINFNKTIYKMLQCAKRLGINNFFEHSPLLCIDFSSATLKDVSYATLKDLLKDTSCGFKKLVLRGIKDETLIFSAQPFQKLKSIEIEDADSLKGFKLEGDSEASCLEELSFCERTRIKTIDVELAPNLKSLWIYGASVVEQLKLSKNRTIHECSIDEKYTFAQDKFPIDATYTISQKTDGIYLYLQEFGGHGGIPELKRLWKSYRNGKQDIERTKNLCAFLDHNVKRLLGLLSLSLEEFLESWMLTETFDRPRFTLEDAQAFTQAAKKGLVRIISDVTYC